MKRLVLNGTVLAVPRTKDKSYLYTLNPSPIHHKSNKIEHQLKIVDYFIQCGMPKQFIIEPALGTYNPDIFYKDINGISVCVEIQITPISTKKMQLKLDNFVKEFGREHDSKILILCSSQNYPQCKLPKGFQLVRQNLPQEINL